MNHATETTKTETFHVGPDLVTLSADRVIIQALNPMEDWTINEFVRRPIYFQDRKMYLRQRGPAHPPFREKYFLLPWPENDQSSPKRFFVYDEHTVEARELALKNDRFEGCVHFLLACISPVVGFLWSGTKERLARFGVDSRKVTGRSIYLEFLILFSEMVFIQIAGGLFSGFLAANFMWMDFLLVFGLAADCVMRYSQHLRNDDALKSLGFFEWLMPSARKRGI